MNTPPTVIITGPTACGKTDLSLELARHFNAPVISADSRQCYRYLDIGTGKVSEDVRAEIPHYHISTHYPDQSCTAFDFAGYVARWKKEITSLGTPVIIAGGSTLYIEALIRPLDPLPPRNDDHIRELEAMADRAGLGEIQKKLREVDPDYLEQIDGLNRHRMFRALDVWMQTGKPFSSFHMNCDISPPRHTIVICLDRDRTELHDRISRRIDQMLDDGLVDEVQSILDMGYHPDLQALKTVGYREPIAWIQNLLSKEQMQELIKTNTRRYARRQLTWFRRWVGVHRFNLTEHPLPEVRNKLIQMIEQLAAES